ncbi:MAG: DUF4386 domain-containing protein [Putridiphycobacter sp.]|nr:DUF4386 domain-containing protein [Putridiphycobacter sp.]
MKPTKKLARQAGILYLLLVPFGVFGILFIPMHFVVPDNIQLTIHKIASDTFTFRLSIMSALVTQLIQILTVLALYQLLKSVHKNAALFMVISILVAVPIAMLNEVNHFAVLNSLGNAQQVSLFLNLHEYGVNIAQIFWGIWLFPMGYLVYKSNFIPKIIGILLVVACFGYLGDSLVFFLNVNLGFTFSEFTFAGEIAITLWLLIKGVKTN